MTTKPHFSLLATSFAGGPRPRNAAIILFGLWFLLFFVALISPPVLDDADGTHAQAARAMATTGHLVTLRVDGVRYLEKAPLPYWLTAISYKVFGFNTFATHLPQAIAVLLLMLLGHRWANQAFGSRTGFYTALAILTSAGVFLFTRILIPEVLLSLCLAAALFAFLKSLGPISAEADAGTVLSGTRLETLDSAANSDGAFAPEVHVASSDHNPLPHSSQSHRDEWVQPQTPERPAYIPDAGPLYPYLMWASLAFAVLAKGLVAMVFFAAATLLYLVLVGEFRASIPRLRPLTGILIFLAIAAPWHVLAALHNPETPTHHGFLWFYFWNEHVLRFLGTRTPADFNKLPGYLYWTLHFVWLFPWALFLPLGITALWRRLCHQDAVLGHNAPPARPLLLLVLAIFLALMRVGKWSIGDFFIYGVAIVVAAVAFEPFRRRRAVGLAASPFHRIDPQQRTILLLSLFAAIVLLFFSLSTNQEYYTFPAYLPILLLIAATITRAEQTYSSNPSAQRWITFAHAAFTVIGAAVAIALLYGLWSSRHQPFVPDIGTLLTRRNFAGNTLSLSHIFDLTTRSFAALRFPSLFAALALAFGPALAWTLRMQRRHMPATITVALTMAAVLLAAQMAFARFGPMLSSQNFAATIQDLEATSRINADDTQVLLYGDQAYGSSIPFYLGEPVCLVNARSTSMLFGSTYPEGAPIFLDSAELLHTWGKGYRKILFVPAEKRAEVDALLASRQIVLEETSGKALITDRPLDKEFRRP